jgi:acyl-CoA synthetase (NDP forming)
MAKRLTDGTHVEIIAVVGASRRPDMVSAEVVRDIVAGGFKGTSTSSTRIRREPTCTGRRAWRRWPTCRRQN